VSEAVLNREHERRTAAHISNMNPAAAPKVEGHSMDGNSFDRLSVVVHRLRDQATRRNALRLLFGGSIAAAMGTFAVDGADARKRHKKKHKNKHKKCRGVGGRCGGNHDCCSGNCINTFCFGGGGGGGKKHCGGRNCPSGWSCCRSGGVSVCVPNTHPTCCGGNSFVNGFNCCGGSQGGACPSGWDCCGGFGQCCSPGWKCCGNGRCCPDGWYCGDFVCEGPQTADISGESVETAPYADPETISDDDWISLSGN
jgi:hypothetical protein